MSIEQLEETTQAMVAAGKGIIAIDESNTTIKKRFDAVGIEFSEDTRRAYREMRPASRHWYRRRGRTWRVITASSPRTPHCERRSRRRGEGSWRASALSHPSGRHRGTSP
jgi:Fructose-bisphosphate aldolase class-I